MEPFFQIWSRPSRYALLKPSRICCRRHIFYLKWNWKLKPMRVSNIFPIYTHPLPYWIVSFLWNHFPMNFFRSFFKIMVKNWFDSNHSSSKQIAEKFVYPIKIYWKIFLLHIYFVNVDYIFDVSSILSMIIWIQIIQFWIYFYLTCRNQKNLKFHKKI